MEGALFTSLTGNDVSSFLATISLITMRYVVIITIVPFLGAKLLPSTIKIIVAVFFGLVTYFFLPNTMAPIAFTEVFLFLILKEALLGAVIGISTSVIFYAFQYAGQLMDFARASSMAQMLIPEERQPSSVMGSFMFQLALVVFIAAGFHRPMLSAIFESFIRFPLTSLVFDDASQLLSTVLFLFTQSLKIAFYLATPVIIFGFIVDLGFGLLNRAASQINVYFLSLPAKILGGLALIFFAIPFLLEDLAHSFEKLFPLIRRLF